tara:strand:- start:334 stop:513 length:180 start_codon:yes stop_codon:yes gene_type:complete
MRQIDSIKVTEWIKEQIAEEIRKAVLSILVYEIDKKIDALIIEEKKKKEIKPYVPCVGS